MARCRLSADGFLLATGSRVAELDSRSAPLSVVIFDTIRSIFDEPRRNDQISLRPQRLARMLHDDLQAEFRLIRVRRE